MGIGIKNSMSTSETTAGFACRLCASENLALYHVMGNDGRYRYFKCANCQLVNYDLATGLAQEHFDEPDKDPMDDSEPWNLDKDQSFRFLSRYVSPPGRMLDIGCGNGRLMYLARKAGWDVKGLELSAVMAKVVRQRLGAAVVVADFLAVEPDAIDAVKFDLICLRHVLEHLPDCLLAMRKLRALLAPSGYVLIELPNVESISKKVKRSMTRRGIRKPVYPENLAIGHANEFCRASFEHLLRETGFELIRWETYSRKPLANLFYNYVHVGSNARALIKRA
jgi:2-polyprenyl-3-methyl-5-hydroxy-6-metoxy-1,4-benzoquinol methylase